MKFQSSLSLFLFLHLTSCHLLSNQIKGLEELEEENFEVTCFDTINDEIILFGKIAEREAEQDSKADYPARARIKIKNQQVYELESLVKISQNFYYDLCQTGEHYDIGISSNQAVFFISDKVNKESHSKLLQLQHLSNQNIQIISQLLLEDQKLYFAASYDQDKIVIAQIYLENYSFQVLKSYQIMSFDQSAFVVNQTVAQFQIIQSQPSLSFLSIISTHNSKVYQSYTLPNNLNAQEFKNHSFRLQTQNSYQYNYFISNDDDQMVVLQCQKETQKQIDNFQLMVTSFGENKYVRSFQVKSELQGQILCVQNQKTKGDVYIVSVTSQKVYYARLKLLEIEQEEALRLYEAQLSIQLSNLIIFDNQIISLEKSCFKDLSLLEKREKYQFLTISVSSKQLSFMSKSVLFSLEEVKEELEIKDLSNNSKQEAIQRRNSQKRMLGIDFDPCDTTLKVSTSGKTTFEFDVFNDLPFLGRIKSHIKSTEYTYYREVVTSHEIGKAFATFDESDCTATETLYDFNLYVEGTLDNHECDYKVQIIKENTAPFVDPVPTDMSYTVSDYGASDSLILDLTAKDGQSKDVLHYSWVALDDNGDQIADPSFFITEDNMIFTFLTENNDHSGTYTIKYEITDDNSCNAAEGVLTTLYEFDFTILILNHPPKINTPIEDAYMNWHDSALKVTMPGFTDSDENDVHSVEFYANFFGNWILFDIVDPETGYLTIAEYDFVSFSYPSVIFHPEVEDDRGIYEFKLAISDSDSVGSGTIQTTEAEFDLMIFPLDGIPFNSPPELEFNFQNVVLRNHLFKKISLPLILDNQLADTITSTWTYISPQGRTYQLKQDPETGDRVYSFITVKEITDREYQVEFYPDEIYLVSDQHQLCGLFQDNNSQGDTRGPMGTGPHCFYLHVQGFNNRPFFNRLQEDIEVQVGETVNLYLIYPVDLDPFDDPGIFEGDYGGAGPFIKLEKKHWIIQPTYDNQEGDYNVVITFIDQDTEKEGTFKTVDSKFTITVTKENTTESIISNQTADENPPQLEILQVNEKGEAILEWSENIKLLEQRKLAIEQGALEFKLIGLYDNYDPNDYLRGFNVTSIQGKRLKIQLEFSNPLKISAYAVSSSFFQFLKERDSLQVTVKLPWFFISEDTGSIAEKNQKTSIRIPPQYSLDNFLALLTANERAVVAVAFFLISGNAALQIWWSAGLNLIWSLLNTLQIIVSLPLMNVNFPIGAFVVSLVFSKIANFNVVSTEDQNSYLLDFQDKEETRIFRFKVFGFGTSNFIQNTGILFWMFIGWFLIAPFIVLLKRLFAQGKIGKFIESTHQNYFFGSLFRLLLEGYYEFFLCSILNIQQPFFQETGEIVGVISSYVFISVLGLILISQVYIIQMSNFKARIRRKENKYDKYFSDFDPDKPYANYFNLAFLLRRTIQALFLIYYQDFVFMQIFCFMLCSLSSFIYINQVKPFKSGASNFLEQMNEMTILVLCYVAMCFSDYKPSNDIQDILGLFFISVIMFTMISNIGCVLFFKQLEKKLTRKKFQRGVSKAIKAKLAIFKIQDRLQKGLVNQVQTSQKKRNSIRKSFRVKRQTQDSKFYSGMALHETIMGLNQKTQDDIVTKPQSPDPLNIRRKIQVQVNQNGFEPQSSEKKKLKSKKRKLNRIKTMKQQRDDSILKKSSPKHFLYNNDINF